MINLSFERKPLKKGTWSVEEDQRLLAYINRYGIWNWNEMPKAAGLLRSGKSCRLRWMNYLKPDIKRGNFSHEEDEIIINLHEMLGNRWSAIASKLPGRTDNEIKNHWHSHLKKRCAAEETKPQELQKHEVESKNITPSSSSEWSSSSSSSINSNPENESYHKIEAKEHNVASSELLGNAQHSFLAESLSIEDLKLMDDQMWLDDNHTNYPYTSPGGASNSSSGDFSLRPNNDHVTEGKVSSSEISGDQFEFSPVEVSNTAEKTAAQIEGSVNSCTSQIVAHDGLFNYPPLWSYNYQAVEMNNIALPTLSEEMPICWENEQSFPTESLLTAADYGLFNGIWQ